MNNLHEIIHMIVSNPEILSQFIKDPQILMDMFHLSPSEVKALLDILNETVLRQLLSPDNLRSITASVAEQVWIPMP